MACLINPTVPFVGHLSYPAFPKMMVQVTGTVPSSGDGFSINLLTTTSEIAFHFNPRPSQQCIVRNAQLGGSWGQEEQDGGYPFTPGAPFDILILFEQESFLTAVNGKHFCEFVYRTLLANVSTVQVKGDGDFKINMFREILPDAIQANSAPLDVGHQMVSPDGKSLTIPAGLQFGTAIAVTGCPNDRSFVINLRRGPNGDTIFHYNPRFFQDCVVRNSLLNGKWGTEERAGGMPFVARQPFYIQIAIESNGYKICVNGADHVTFAHRAPPQDVTLVECCDFEPANLQYIASADVMPAAAGGLESFSPMMPMPYVSMPPMPPMPPMQPMAPIAMAPMAPMPPMALGPMPAPMLPPLHPTYPATTPPVTLLKEGRAMMLPDRLQQGQSICFSGVLLAKSGFEINFREAPEGQILFHYNPRLSEGFVARNAYLGGAWGVEERDGGMPFELNVAKNVEIIVEADAYRVRVNGKDHVRFKHRAPPQLVAYVECTPDPNVVQVCYLDRLAAKPGMGGRAAYPL